MQVAEFVPEITLLQRGLIGHTQMVWTGNRFQHSQMCGLRFVEAGEQTVYGIHPTLGGNDQARPTLARMHLSW